MIRSIATCFILLTTLLLAPSAALATRYPIAITGDSVVESRTMRNAANNGYAGLGAMVHQKLASQGVTVGGYGFIPMHSSTEVEPYPWMFSGSWSQKGMLYFPGSKINYGIDGMASESSEAGDNVSLGLAANRVGVAYLAGPGGARVRISVDGKSPTTFSTSSSQTRPAIYWRPVSWGLHRIKLENLGGNFRLNGLIAARVQSSSNEVEINQIGRGGDTAAGNFAPLNKAGLLTLSPKLTVIMFGSNEEAWETLTGDRAWRDRYKNGLIARAKVAKQTGKCVIVPHAPNNRPQALQDAYAAAAAAAAKASGCLYRPIFKGIWNGQTSIADGLTSDGIHPTERGYEVISSRLATMIKGLI